MSENQSFDASFHERSSAASLEPKQSDASLVSPLESQARKIERLRQKLATQEKILAHALLQTETGTINQHLELRCEIANLKLQVSCANRSAHVPVSLPQAGSTATSNSFGKTDFSARERLNDVPEKDVRQPAALAREMPHAPDQRDVLSENPAMTRLHGQNNGSDQEPIGQLQHVSRNAGLWEPHLQTLIHAEARFTELQEHVMALHRQIDDQEQRLSQQAQLLQLQCDQIRHLEGILERSSASSNNSLQ